MQGGREGVTIHLGSPAMSFSDKARQEVLLILLFGVDKTAGAADLDRKACCGRAQGMCGSRWGNIETGRIKAFATHRTSGSNRNGAPPEQ
jgi:hypothetical protein